MRDDEIRCNVDIGLRLWRHCVAVTSCCHSRRALASPREETSWRIIVKADDGVGEDDGPGEEENCHEEDEHRHGQVDARLLSRLGVVLLDVLAWRWWRWWRWWWWWSRAGSKYG